MAKPKQTRGKRRESNNGTVQSVRRAVLLLNALAESGGGAGVLELSQRLDLSQSTVFRTLSTLEGEGYVVKNPSTDRYQLGLQVVSLAGTVLNQSPLRKAALPVLRDLSEKTRCNANLAILFQGKAFYIARYEPSTVTRVHMVLGRKAPPHATALGKVLLAFLENGGADDLIDRPLESLTAKTVTDQARLREDLVQIRTQGYALDEEEFMEGTNCMAVPVRGHDGKVICSLSISGPNYAVPRSQLEGYLPTLLAASTELSSRLGFVS